MPTNSFIDAEKLCHWFLLNKRDFPWREVADPYAIWISEVMLQQTQAAVVIPYFLRWMESYPTIQHLADAHIDDVIKIWEGLGYYSRARNLHNGARYIVDYFNGVIPDSAEKLKQIKGLGPYTIGAILSFAFHQKTVAVDGNVLRVLARYYQIDEDITKVAVQKKIRLLVEEMLPSKNSWVFNEALIELGATICQRKAQCGLCPLNKNCLSFLNHSTNDFPIKSTGPKTTLLRRIVAVIECNGEYLLQRGKEGKVMADLHEFLSIECKGDKKISSEELLIRLSSEYRLNGKVLSEFPLVKHSYTRYRVILEAYHIRVEHKIPVMDFEWHKLENLGKLSFSSGHRRILQNLLV
jgi:A/G-specific adenine glycosylase